jgi:predicted DNA-binding ribbon-helix-helix protein
MPTTKPRINIILEEPLYRIVEEMAVRDGVSLSLKARDLIREALDIREDVALSSFARSREKTYRKSKALKHEEVW